MIRRPILSLDPARCDKCMTCVRLCPQRAVEIGTGYVFVDWSRCDGCGKCADFCEPGAIRPRPATATVAATAEVTQPAPVATPAPAVVARIAPRGATSSFTAPWEAWEVAVMLAAVLGLFALQHFASSSEWMLSTVPIGARPLIRGGILALCYAMQLGLLAALGARKGVGFAEAFGLRPARLWPSALGVLGLVIVTRVGAVAYGMLAERIGWQVPAAPVMQYFGRDTVGMVLTITMVVVVGPFFEEVVFRGVLLGFLTERIGSTAAIWTSALLFAAFHLDAWLFVPVAMMGLAAGWLAVRERSLWPAIALHVGYNAVAVALAFSLPK